MTDTSDCRNVEDRKHIIRLKTLDVKNINGLTVAIDFHRSLTNITGMMSGGRTRLVDIFYAMRGASYTGYRDVPGIIKHYDDSSRMSMTLTYDDCEVVWAAGFREIPDVDDGEEPFYLLEPFWRIINENGEIICHYGRDSEEEISDEHAQVIADCIFWLTHNVITNFKEALEHMSGLPYGIMGGLMGVSEPREISENIGRLIPWLAMFTTESNLLFWADDIYDSIHTLVVRRFAEEVGSRARKERNQYIMSSRDADAMVDTYPCWFMMDGRAVKISQEAGRRDELYLFHDDGDRWYGWKRMLDDEFDKVRKDVTKKLSEVE